MALSQEQRNFIRLLQRSPADEAGWRKVSAVCWQLTDCLPAELIERERYDNLSGRVRLTFLGIKIAEYAL